MFSDTLALDRAAVNLPKFITDLQNRLRSPDTWQSDPLRIVPAPKSQRWAVRVDSGAWEPRDKRPTAARLRPLAHVTLADQVVATALMLCLADRVETRQDDPRRSVADAQSRKSVLSYGNRLFCDSIGGELRHRWGSTKLYRAYYQDYQTFIARPQLVADALQGDDARVFVVHADIRQFYDRVRPESLTAALDRIQHDGDDPGFFALLRSVFDWRWHQDDAREVDAYAESAQLADFARVALPQGLVAAGFFANVVLLSFDEHLRRTIGRNIAPGITLADVCRYVDDLRLTVTVAPAADNTLAHVREATATWLQRLLSQEAPGLLLSAEKMRVAAFGGDERPVVRQSAKMTRIQGAVSGGFDAFGGDDILDAIQGLVRTQETLTTAEDPGWHLTPVPDVHNETVARFAAARFRVTFRSLRPLLPERHHRRRDAEKQPWDVLPQTQRIRATRTRRELDEDARNFALGLIQRWICDPSNVRLLRIGLDLWPDVELLNEVLKLLRPFTEKGARRGGPRRVVWYCLSEIFRAGATETGFVADGETLPAAVDVKTYRAALRDEAARVLQSTATILPWYLRQQALLFLAAFDPVADPAKHTGAKAETRHYWELHRFLRGEDVSTLDSGTFATLVVLARRGFVDRQRASALTLPSLNASRLEQIATRDPALTLELLEANPRLLEKLPLRAREDLSRDVESAGTGFEVLAAIVLAEHPAGPLRNELGLLRFAIAFLRQWQAVVDPLAVITPGQVQLKRANDAGISQIEEVRILQGRAEPSGSLYGVPEWCDDENRWRFQVGFLLRFILSGQHDFTLPVRPAHWKEPEPAYRPVVSHWYQRLYGLFNGRTAFGDEWLPVSDWIEDLLLTLLRWPGCSRAVQGFEWVDRGVDAAIDEIGRRIDELEGRRGRATGTLLLRVTARRRVATRASRALYGCVVQTAIPRPTDFGRDLTVSGPRIRRMHRDHLAAALAAVRGMLDLRSTHERGGRRLDWLILPELAVHPDDVRTHLIPFARAHNTIVLAGLTYEKIAAGHPLFNSALWIIPEWSRAHGLQMRTLRQGKRHLAPDEQLFNSGRVRLQGFRPCQWLVGYPWSNEEHALPVWITASVCYDATDLGLVADLRGQSDVFAIPALNRDVRTFDQMALALHYHMFQLVVVANNGQYGGSNAYWPRGDLRARQLFHTHGQSQASIAFFSIDDVGDFLTRDQAGLRVKQWKHPPAGLER